ncbi:MAG: 50S ribosomal protein L11 methyltransferase [Candidatus Marinimicrobia bacterium]|nr:50S ribosomal protein L11 methyltransferase [Candidatus Neomarinimicrobiota bacterium]
MKESFYENISLNGIQEKVELKICDVIDIDDFDFDLIISNIDIKSNVKLLNSIGKFGEFPPRMIFTGILEKDMENFITQAETFGLKVTNTGTLKEWGAIVF